MTDRPKCQTCPFWEQSKSNASTGLCRRHAPNPQIEDKDTPGAAQFFGVNCYWPKTNSWDGCGDHPAYNQITAPAPAPAPEPIPTGPPKKQVRSDSAVLAVCPACQMRFRLLWKETKTNPKTIFVLQHREDNRIRCVSIECPNCQYTFFVGRS